MERHLLNNMPSPVLVPIDHQNLLNIDDDYLDISINDSDLELLPNNEDLKRYVLNGTRDATSSDYILSLLTDEELNNFILFKYSNVGSVPVKQYDSSPLDMHAKATHHVSSTQNKHKIKAATAVKEPTVTLDDFVNIEACKDAAIPVLKADNLNLLLEQFEAIPAVREPTFKMDQFVNIESREDAAIPVVEAKDLKSFIEKFEAFEKVKTKKRLDPVFNVEDSKGNRPNHDHCSHKKQHSDLKKGQSLSKLEVLSNNNKMLGSRQRLYKNKTAVYQDSTDEKTREKISERKAKKVKKCDDAHLKKKTSEKAPGQSECCEKLSSPQSNRVKNKILGLILKKKNYNPVRLKSACKASDNFNQNYKGTSLCTRLNYKER